MTLYKKITTFILVIGVFFIISFICNNFPANSIVAGGDFYQLYDYSEQLDRYLYTWFNQSGQGIYNPIFVSIPFYFLFSLLEKILDQGEISSSILFTFLSLSFLAFYYAIHLLIPSQKFFIKTFGSLMYALNPFVLTIFTYPWGFTHHYIIYIFFPLIMSSFLHILFVKNVSKFDVVRYLVINFLSIVAYNNIAFYIMVLFSQGISLVYFIILSRFKITMFFVKKVLFLFLSSIILVIPLFFSTISYLLSDVSKGINNQSALGGENYLYGWIKSTSSTPINSVLLALDSYHYPFVDNILSPFFVIHSSLFFLILIFLLYKNRLQLFCCSKDNLLILTSLFSFVSFFILTIRYYGPFEILNKLFYQFPVFIFFRSQDKLFIPFVFFYVLSITLLISKTKIQSRLMLISIVVFLTVPFCLNIIPKTLQNDFNRFSSKIKPEYSYLIEIPSEYIKLAKLLNSGNKNTAILSLPSSVKNSVNWSNYPMWNFVGVDILHLIFKQRYISANSFDHPSLDNTMSLKDISASDSSILDLKNSIEKFGTEIVLFHKDIDRGLLAESQFLKQKINLLEDEEYLTQLMETDLFTAYSLNKKFVLPMIFNSSSSATLEFKKINPTLFIVNISGETAGQLQLLQSFDNNWSLGLIDKRDIICYENTNYYLDERIKECVSSKSDFLSSEIISIYGDIHSSRKSELCNNYSNCWNTDALDIENNSIVIFYKNQVIVYWYVFLGFLVLVFLVGFTLSIVRARFEKK